METNEKAHDNLVTFAHDKQGFICFCEKFWLVSA